MGPGRRLSVGPVLPLLPFLLYVLVFLVVPTLTVVVGAFMLLLLLSSTLVTEVTVNTMDRVLTDFGLGIMSLLMVFLAIFLSSGLLSKEIERRTIETFEEIGVDEDWTPEQAKLVRPSATWTYLVHDSPFGSEMERLISVVGRGIRKRR